MPMVSLPLFSCITVLTLLPDPRTSAQALLSENENLQKAREKCRQTIELLGKAMQILMEVREFTV